MTRKKQIAETIFREAAGNFGIPFYVKKFQTNPLAHQSNEADYLVSTEHRLHFVEVKEIDLASGNRFAFSRLTQMTKLLLFVQAVTKHRGWLFLYFRGKSKAESVAYCIPIEKFCDYITKSRFKSINLRDCNICFAEYTWVWNKLTKRTEIFGSKELYL